MSDFFKSILDPKFFIETFIKLIDGVNPPQSVELNDFQIETLDKYVKNEERLFVIDGDRQVGKTFLLCCIVLHNILLSRNINYAIIVRDSQQREALYDRIIAIAELAEDFFTIKKYSKARRQLDFDNGCRITIYSNKNYENMRGCSFETVYMDTNNADTDKILDKIGSLRSKFVITRDL